MRSVPGGLACDPNPPAGSRRFAVCAELVCARARDYSTTPRNTGVTKFTFNDLT